MCPALAWTLDAQNKEGSDTNEPVVFTVGKRAKEKGGPGRLEGPQSCSEDSGCCAHMQDKVEGGRHTVSSACAHLAALHLPQGLDSQPCKEALVLVATLGLPERQTQGIFISFVTTPAYWDPVAVSSHGDACPHQGLASAASSHLGGEDAVFRAQFIEGASVHAKWKC